MIDKAIAHLAACDPKLAAVMPHLTLPDVEIHNDIYHDLLGSIISQQLSVKAAATIENRFFNLFPDRQPYPALLVTMETEVLRGCGLSGQKASYMRNIAQYWIDNQALNRDWRAMSDDEIIAALTTIKGVGKWTVQMILMFRLNRPDVFPIDDLGIRQGMIKLYEVQETGKDLVRCQAEQKEVLGPYLMQNLDVRAV